MLIISISQDSCDVYMYGCHINLVAFTFCIIIYKCLHHNAFIIKSIWIVYDTNMTSVIDSIKLITTYQQNIIEGFKYHAVNMSTLLSDIEMYLHNKIMNK